MKTDPNAYHYTAQVFDGGNMFNVAASIGNIGDRNISIAEQVLTTHKIRIVHRETGGTKGRKIYFDTSKNKVECSKLNGAIDSKKFRIQYERVFKAIEEIFPKECK